MNATLTTLETLTPEEKFLLLDDEWTREHPQFDHRPARSVLDFVMNPFYLGLKGQVWETPMQDLVEYYQSGRREAWLVEAIGAGKSFKASIIAAYETHKLLCLKNPQRFFNLSQSSKISILNMSVRAKQAYDIVFGEIQGKIDNSYWFKRYAPHDPNIKSEYQFEKNILILPGNSKETTPLGYSILVGILDEANFFTDTGERDNAGEVYEAMDRRIFSRFRDYGRLVVITSPNYDGDFTSSKTEGGIPANVFYRSRPLWEARKHDYVGVPFVEVEKGFKIPKTLVAEFRKNPEKFKRDIAAISIGAHELFFKDRVAVREALKLENNWTDGAIRDDYKSSGTPHYIHIDLAKSKDAAAMAMVHPVGGNRIACDFMVRIKAEPGGEIKISQFREIVFALRKRGFHIAKATLDGWQSLDTIQQFTAKGIASEVLSVDSNLGPYDTLKDVIYGGALDCVNDQTLYGEMKRLQLIKGKKVDHPKSGSKDMSDALAGATFNCVEGENLSDFTRQYSGEFVEKVHIQSIDPEKVTGTLTRYAAMVPVLNGESVIIWAFVDREEMLCIYDEQILKRATADMIADVIDEAEGTNRIEERFYPVDKLTKKKDGAHGFSLIEQLDERDLSFKAIEYTDELASINIREGLRFDQEKPLGNGNLPGIYFHPRCKNTIAAIRYFMDRKNGENQPLFETLHKAVGTLVLAEPEWVKR